MNVAIILIQYQSSTEEKRVVRQDGIRRLQTGRCDCCPLFTFQGPLLKLQRDKFICETLIKPWTQSKPEAPLALMKALQPNRPSANVMACLRWGNGACAILELTRGSGPPGGRRLSQMSAWSHCSVAAEGPSWTPSSLWPECSRPCTASTEPRHTGCLD